MRALEENDFRSVWFKQSKFLLLLGMRYRVTSKRLDEKILAVHVDRDIYTGGTGRKLVNQDTGEVMCRSSKSIRTIASHGDYICCGSYDCTATLLYKGRVVDVVEGPDTEVKCVAFSEDGRYLAMATRGRSVWITRVGDEIEIDKILEDHLQDVKGCIFHNGFLFTYGYDNTIKMYDRFDYDDSWEMVQSIEETNTVWSVAFHQDRMVCSTEDGTISLYVLRNGWELEESRRMSRLPIYSVCSVGDNIAYVLNGNSIGIVDSQLGGVVCVGGVHSGLINSISYGEGRLASGGDDGVLGVVELGL